MDFIVSFLPKIDIIIWFIILIKNRLNKWTFVLIYLLCLSKSWINTTNNKTNNKNPKNETPNSKKFPVSRPLK